MKDLEGVYHEQVYISLHKASDSQDKVWLAQRCRTVDSTVIRARCKYQFVTISCVMVFSWPP